MRQIEGLSRLADAYEALFCDIWGVVHDGAAPFAEACAATSAWRAQVGPVILVSNSPRPAAGVAAQLAELGVPRTAWSAIVTSGDACRALLAERSPGPAWRIGPARDDPLFEGLGLRFCDPAHARFIACSGPDDDEVETPADYRDRLAFAAGRGLVMVCANPDILVQRGSRLIYCGGALAALYQELGGAVVMAGKPHAPIYDLARAAAAAALGRPAPASRTLVIGDGLATDLRGAAEQGLDKLLIADGVHGAELLDPAQGLDLAAAQALLAAQGLDAEFVMARLAW